MRRLMFALAAVTLVLPSASGSAQQTKYYELAKGDYPHDVAAAASGEVWFAGQRKGIAGRLDPKTGGGRAHPVGQQLGPAWGDHRA